MARPPVERPLTVSEWWLRAGGIAVVLVVLLLVPKSVLDRLAGMATVIVPVATVWVLFDRRVLRWVVRRIDLILRSIRVQNDEGINDVDAVKAAEPAKTPPSSRSKPAAPTPVVPERPEGNPKSIVLGFLVFAPIFGIILFDPVSDWFAGDAGSRGQGQEGNATTELEAPTSEASPTNPEPNRASEVETSTTGEPWSHSVRDAEYCWTMALRCVGDGTRYTELIPLNPDVTIDDQGRCDVRAGNDVKLPATWRQDCLD